MRDSDKLAGVIEPLHLCIPAAHRRIKAKTRFVHPDLIVCRNIAGRAEPRKTVVPIRIRGRLDTTILLLVSQSVTVAPAIGAPLNVTVPETLSVSGGVPGLVMPGSFRLAPLQPPSTKAQKMDTQRK